MIRFLSIVTKYERYKINESLADHYTVTEFTCACDVRLISRNFTAFYPISFLQKQLNGER